MGRGQHNRNVSFIWSVADDELRDVYLRGKYRQVILAMPTAMEELRRGVIETGGIWEVHAAPPAAETGGS